METVKIKYFDNEIDKIEKISKGFFWERTMFTQYVSADVHTGEFIQYRRISQSESFPICNDKGWNRTSYYKDRRFVQKNRD